MVRAYEPEPIPRETIERIVGTRAPSAGFSQGQRLVVVTDAGTRKRIADILEESSPAPRSGATLEQWLTAPVLIVVGVREDDYHERYRKQDKLTDGTEIEWPIPYWHFDAGAAAMLILLAAIDEGYAAGLFGVFAGATRYTDKEERGRSRPLGALGLGRPDLRDELLLVVAGVLARGVERLDGRGVRETAARVDAEVVADEARRIADAVEAR